MRLVLTPTSPTDPDAVALIERLNRLLDELYDPNDNHFRLEPGEVEGDAGVFLLARRRGVAVGCGAIRMLGDGRAEVKRMFVDSEAQGTGVGRAILTRLEAEARRRGAVALVLEMGDSQPAAAGLYRSWGFEPIPCWGEYRATPNSICLGKDLGPGPAI